MCENSFQIIIKLKKEKREPRVKSPINRLMLSASRHSARKTSRLVSSPEVTHPDDDRIVAAGGDVDSF
eukprot:CAMPEP_0170499624 /NCGR_PEP_ID=MMETSP0208-20121228/32031_1 /TAXON_ID=197538 /ORGANISM="Strombidium inclinatum, Strain S3" /LENGTH=67 /DNA_ID=CAMNT_0010777259 /DNA_START=2285 /DNA_END=2488 /DNA_ORIENTATION=+